MKWENHSMAGFVKVTPETNGDVEKLRGWFPHLWPFESVVCDEYALDKAMGMDPEKCAEARREWRESAARRVVLVLPHRHRGYLR